MEILEDPVFKTNYQKYKVRVKLWESRFTEKHGRKPDKNDIKEADIKIKEAYKMYWRLKTRALEETLTDITFCDDVQDNVPNIPITQTLVEEYKEDNKPPSDECVNENMKQIIDSKDERNVIKEDIVNTNKNDIEGISEKNIENVKKKDMTNVDPYSPQRNPINNESVTKEAEYKNVHGVWGEHLNKGNEVPKKKQSLSMTRSSSFQLSQNKFTSSSFIKRNPRKSLSASKIKSKSEKNININANTVEQAAHIDTISNDGFDNIEETMPILGEPVKVTYTEHKPIIQSIGTLQQLIEGHTITRNVNPGWLDRCAKQNNLKYPALDSQRLSGTSDSGIESMEFSIQSPRENVPVLEQPKSVQVSDEEDFVCNSDSEEERRNKRIRNFKKRFSDSDNCPPKRICMDNSINAPAAQQVLSNMNAHSTANFNTVSSNPVTTTVTNNIRINLTNESNKTENVPQIVNTNANDLDDVDETDVTPPQRKVRRRIRRISSNDSDPDYDNDKKLTKKKEPKAPRARTTKKTKNPAKAPTLTGEKKAVRTKKVSSKKKKNTKDKTDLEIDTVDEEQNTGPLIYGVETLEAVPRFTVKPHGRGDLIEQYAKSVSCTGSDSETISKLATKSKGKLTDKEKLEKKIADGKVNENFVRINLKKKVFVRGKKNFNFSKYKKYQWKQKKKELASSEGSLHVADYMEKVGVSKCFHCGDVGHFSSKCPNKKADDLIPLEEVDDSSAFLTLEEAQKMASENAVHAHINRIDRLPEKPSFSYTDPSESVENETEDKNEDLWEHIDDEEILCGHKIPEELVSKLLPPEVGVVQPLYNAFENQSCINTPSEVFEALRTFGHESFRPGQEKAVMRILSGQSTLVTLSTGSGKSLCYQLPAYLYSKHSHCITLVISPLVSLMDDQVTGVPAFLSAACLHTNQTQKVKDNVMQMVKQGKINILLISPEAAVAGEKSTGFGALLRQLPPVAFACIDEAHCISQWSHNFRPSYLMVCRVLREKLGVRTILALTATATKATAESIVDQLSIHDGLAGVISDIPMPRNLLLTVSKDEHRDHALVNLLLSERFKECDSVIVYCTRREECARIAGILRISLQNTNNPDKSNSKLSPIAEAYHAGLTAHRRKIVQKAFMSGNTRIVVATIAFGMGLNKPDIRAVIHYNMPGTFEGYVQEVGRAGRDGLLAHCHMFLSPTEDSDKWELRRHIYANGVDRHTIRRLLEKIFVPCSCAKIRGKVSSVRCPGHEVAIPIDETVLALDISAESIATLLCYLELHPKRFIKVLSSVYVRAKVSSYNGAKALKHAAQSSPPLAMAIALDLQKGVSHDDSNVIEFPVVDVASAIGWDSGVVKSHLKNLEWKTVNGAPRRSSISVKYHTLGLRVKAPGDLTDDELDEALDALFGRAQTQEATALLQLETIGQTLHKLSVPRVVNCAIINDEMTSKSDTLKGIIRRYFEGEVLVDVASLEQSKVDNETEIAGDVRNLIVNYRDNNFTGRAIARIFHGIQSPNYPAYVWNKCRFWRAHLSCNFSALRRIATKEILALR